MTFALVLALIAPLAFEPAAAGFHAVSSTAQGSVATGRSEAEGKPASKSASVIKDGAGAVLFLRFSPDGRELARICMFGPVALFDTTSYDKARTFPVGMRMVAYSPDGTRIATAEGTDGARVWDAAVTGKPVPNSELLYLLDTPLQVLQAASRDSKQRVFWTEFSPDGKHLITTQANGHVKVWNTSSWLAEGDFAVSESEVRAATFSPDSKVLVIGDTSGLLHHWSVETKAEIKTTRVPSGAITGVVFAPDGKTLVTSQNTGEASGSSVTIWDTSSWVALQKENFGSAAFSRDGTILALGGRNIELIEVASRKGIRTINLPEMSLREVNRLFADHPQGDQKIPIVVDSLAFSPDGKTLAAGCKDGTVRLVQLK